MSAVAAPPVARAATVTKPVAGRPPLMRIASPPVTLQCASSLRASSLRVSSPHDPAEKEAETTARRVMYQPAPAHTLRRADAIARPSAQLARMAGHIVQRDTALTRIMRQGVPPSLRQSSWIARAQQEGQPSTSANIDAEIRQSQSTGTPLPPSVRRFMEPRFAADFSNIRVHAGDKAANLSRQLSARAFTVGNSIFFGEGQYQPDSHDGRELLAHELTHTIQQGAATQTLPVQRSAVPEIRQHSDNAVQRGFLPDPFEYISNKANSIPGFTMFTVVIGYNPITKASVDRSAGNILRGAIELIPGGSYITEALNNHGIFDKISTWTKTQFDTIKDIGSNIWNEIKQFVKTLGPSDLGDLEGAWNRGKKILTGPIDQMIAFAENLKDGIVQLIKDAILRPIGAYAQTTSGYKLLCSVMGSDPITGDPAPQDAEALMGAFMIFIGEEETWATMQKANAVPRAFAWFKGAVEAVKGFVAEIPGLFVAAFKSLEIMDIVLIPRAFIKLGKVFGSFAGRFISWGANAVWNLLEIIFDVVKPGVMGYVKRTGGALKDILKNPMPFVGNLVAAGKLGFQQFAARFGTHLKAGLIDWLTGSLPGVYIPASFELKEILKFALSVLGLTWANVRVKLVKATSETIVKGLETTFDIVVTLVREGPAAAWAKIKEHLGNLKDMVIGGITDFVIDMVVKKAVPKIISMFIPGAGFIGAILSIYDTIMVFVQKLSKIAAVVGAFVNSIVQIAAGNIAGAAKRVESVLAGLLSLAISFLAGFAGLGKVADKVMAVIQKVRAPIDKALDAVINWIVTTAKKLFAKLFGKDKDAAKDGDKDPDKEKKVAAGLAALDAADKAALKDGLLEKEAAQKIAVSIKQQHPVFKSVTVIETAERYDYEYVASPKKTKKGEKKSDPEGDLKTARATFKQRLFPRDELDTAIKVSPTTSLRRINDWKSKSILYTLASNSFDPLTQYSFDKEKSGQRDTNPNNRSKYGYSNPSKSSGVGLQILSIGFLKSRSPAPYQLGNAAYHQEHAWYKSVISSMTFQYDAAILGHKPPGASGHWNSTGHTQTRDMNMSWNKKLSSYHGPEHKAESSASGGSSERYRVPSKAAGSHPSWW